MAAGDVSLLFRLFGKDESASDTFKKTGKNAETMGDKIHKGVKLAATAAAGAAVGGIAVLSAAVVQGVKDASSYQTLSLKTAAVLKSTGNAAGTSVPHIQDLAGSLESMSGVDEELIINSQNVLATFTQVQNQAGKNNDIFDQGTKAALNLSTAMGGDLQGATVQVGKALNDPIKGITALQRVGVSFTQQQKDQITAMVKSGNTMGAQKLILGELNKEFGGSAKAAGAGFAGSMARAQDAIADAGRSLGMILLPYLTRFANWVATKGVPAIVTFAHWVGPRLTVAWNATWAAAKRIGSFFTGTLWPAIEQGRKMVMPLLKFAMDNVKQGFGDLTSTGIDFKGLAVALWPILKTIAIVIGGAVVLAITALSTQFRVAAFVIKNVVIPAVAFLVRIALKNFGDLLDGATTALGWIPGIGPKLKVAQAQFRTFRDAVNTALDGIKDEKVNVIVGYKTVLSSKGAQSAAQVYHFPALSVPKMARGGIVTSPTLAMIGEAGPEAVVPLSGASGGFGELTQAIRELRQTLQSPRITDAQVTTALGRVMGRGSILGAAAS